MNTSALIIMLTTQITIVAFTVYFFWKMLKSKPNQKEETDE